MEKKLKQSDYIPFYFKAASVIIFVAVTSADLTSGNSRSRTRNLNKSKCEKCGFLKRRDKRWRNIGCRADVLLKQDVCSTITELDLKFSTTSLYEAYMTFQQTLTLFPPSTVANPGEELVAKIG